MELTGRQGDDAAWSKPDDAESDCARGERARKAEEWLNQVELQVPAASEARYCCHAGCHKRPGSNAA